METNSKDHLRKRNSEHSGSGVTECLDQDYQKVPFQLGEISDDRGDTAENISSSELSSEDKNDVTEMNLSQELRDFKRLYFYKFS